MAMSLLAGAAPMVASTVTGDAERGAELFRECKLCHQAGRGARHRIGPHLNSILDRAVGSIAGYRFSRAMRSAGESGLSWTRETLDAFLADPRAVVPRSRMSYAGMANSQDRADLVAYLARFSRRETDLPEAQATLSAAEVGIDPAILRIEGDPEYGAYLAGECTACHRLDGEYEGIPSIVGWPREEFVLTLHAYKRGLREHEVMEMTARRLSDEEIAALAAYFGNLGDNN